jgi:hypothetical protein
MKARMEERAVHREPATDHALEVQSLL